MPLLLKTSPVSHLNSDLPPPPANGSPVAPPPNGLPPPPNGSPPPPPNGSTKKIIFSFKFSSGSRYYIKNTQITIKLHVFVTTRFQVPNNDRLS